MLLKVKSASVLGVEAEILDIEVDLSLHHLTRYHVVGLPDLFPLGQEGDEPPVRTHRGGDVLPPRPRGWSQEQRSGLTRSLPSGHEGKVLALDGLFPCDRETV